MPRERGQAFAAYRLLIGAIIALMMLVIIIGGLSQVEEIKFRVSVERLFTGAQNAVQSPNKDVVVVENMTLKKGTQFSTSAFATKMGIPGECITFDAREAAAFELRGNVVEIIENVEIDLYAMCFLRECSGSPISCVISFDRAINPDEW